MLHEVEKQPVVQPGKIDVRSKVSPAPTGFKQLKYLGPGILWALSSAGAGEIFYSPRIGARYGYNLIWAALLVVILVYLITHEVGRYTVVSGKTIMEGYCELSGPSRWAVWLFIAAQVGDLALTVAGHAALTAVMFLLILPGAQIYYSSAAMIIAGGIIVVGGYAKVNKFSALLAGALLATALYAVLQVFPPFGKFASGFIPAPPGNLDLYFVLPWIGFLVIHGAPWFSYWVAEQGFAGGLERHDVHEPQGKNEPAPNGSKPAANPAVSQEEVLAEARRQRDELKAGTTQSERIKKWLTLMAWTDGIGSGLALLFALIFVTLGAQLITGGSIPDKLEMGPELAHKVQSTIGQIAFYLFIFTTAFSFWSTVMDTQDGASRLLADSTAILSPKAGEEQDGKAGGWLLRHLNNRPWMLKAYVIAIGVIVPLLLLLFIGKPLVILSAAGILSAGEAAVFTFLTIWLNKSRLPKDFQPGWLATSIVVFGGFFYFVVTSLTILQLLGFNLLSGGGSGSGG